MSPHQSIGHYLIGCKIGEGGMGAVYRATDTKLGRDVAIKVLPDAFAQDADRMARFGREAQVLASLNHPNIAAIYGVEERALVMELVEGATLAERIADGAIPLEEALPIAGQIAEALECAHERGVIHRDLKPANIKITPEGRVKVLDFGLAKAMDTGSPSTADLSNSPTLTFRATQIGLIMGTAAYMSPEQARGKVVDKRSDIWAFGVVLYEMLTAKPLFAGDVVSDILASVLKDEPNLSAAPAPVRRLLVRCLQKDPKKRLRDIGDYADLLQPASPATTAQVSRFPWVAIAAVSTLVALSLAGWIAFQRAPLPPVMRFQIEAPPGSTLPLGTPAPSPDGRTLAYTVRAPGGVRSIHLRPLDSTESRSLPGTENATHPFWSPDGRSLAFTADFKLKRIDLAGGPPRVLADITGPWHGSWSQDGIILYQGSSGTMQVPDEGGPGIPVAEPGDKPNPFGNGFPFFLSDGKRFLKRVGSSIEGSGDIELLALGSPQRKTVLREVFSAPILAPVPRGKAYLLYISGASLMAREFDEKTGAARGNAFALVDQIGRVANPRNLPSVGVSRSGVLAYQTNVWEKDRLGWFDRSGKSLGQLPLVSGGDGLAMSPDARFAAMHQPSNGDIWIADLTRGSSTRFTFAINGKNYVSPVWSPDGKRIAYHLVGGDLYVKDASGTAPERQLLRGEAFPLSWSQDGSQILLLQTGRLFLLPLGATTPVAVGPAEGVTLGGAAISPDGKYFAFTSRESGHRQEVYLEEMPPGAGKWQISIDGGQQPCWRRDGKELYFLAPDGKLVAVEIRTGQVVTAGIPHVLFQTGAPTGPGMRYYDVSPDGQRFLVISPDGSTENAPITVVVNWWAGLKNK